MDSYKHILLAVDFSNDAEEICKRAADIAKRNNAEMTLIHVLEEPTNIGAGYELVPVLPDVTSDQSLQDNAREALERLASNVGLNGNVEKKVVPAISTKAGILETAEESRVDLIVVGSHGRHGLALLLGSTANAVLHGAPCDVLAVRIKDED